MKLIPLTKGHFTVVDDGDYERLTTMGKWHYSDGYAQKKDKKTRKTIKMHQVILQVDPPLEVDHRDGDGLNNIRSNLRPATKHDNQGNSGKRSVDKTSKFKGVSYDRQSGKWRSQIRTGGHNLLLGRFQSEIEAAKAYDDAACSYFGEFAVTNF